MNKTAKEKNAILSCIVMLLSAFLNIPFSILWDNGVKMPIIINILVLIVSLLSFIIFVPKEEK